MALSGTTDFTLTSRQIINRALRLVKVISLGEDPTDAEANDAIDALNLLLKTWGSNKHLWLYREGVETLTTATQSYVLTDVFRVTDVRSRINSQDLPLQQLSRSDYYNLPNKSSQGTPVNWYFDPLRSVKTLYVWPTASAALVATGATLRYTYVKIIDDVDTLDNEADVPQEWLEALTYTLSDRLCFTYGATPVPPTQRGFGTMGEQLVAAISVSDQESVSVYFQPDWQGSN